MKKSKRNFKKIELEAYLAKAGNNRYTSKKKEVHVTAYSLEKMLINNKVYISRATIYNNLNELSSKGYLKKVIVKKDKIWFDTNLSKHHHFYDEEEDKLFDINENEINFSMLPSVPKGKKIKSVDIIINIKKH